MFRGFTAAPKFMGGKTLGSTGVGTTIGSEAAARSATGDSIACSFTTSFQVRVSFTDLLGLSEGISSRKTGVWVPLGKIRHLSSVIASSPLVHQPILQFTDVFVSLIVTNFFLPAFS